MLMPLYELPYTWLMTLYWHPYTLLMTLYQLSYINNLIKVVITRPTTTLEQKIIKTKTITILIHPISLSLSFLLVPPSNQTLLIHSGHFQWLLPKSLTNILTPIVAVLTAVCTISKCLFLHIAFVIKRRSVNHHVWSKPYKPQVGSKKKKKKEQMNPSIHFYVGFTANPTITTFVYFSSVLLITASLNIWSPCI